MYFQFCVCLLVEIIIKTTAMKSRQIFRRQITASVIATRAYSLPRRELLWRKFRLKQFGNELIKLFAVVKVNALHRIEF